MGNYICIKCGVPLNYYTNNEHASRHSCRYHDNFVNCSKECKYCKNLLLKMN